MFADFSSSLVHPTDLHIGSYCSNSFFPQDTFENAELEVDSYKVAINKRINCVLGVIMELMAAPNYHSLENYRCLKAEKSIQFSDAKALVFMPTPPC